MGLGQDALGILDVRPAGAATGAVEGAGLAAASAWLDDWQRQGLVRVASDADLHAAAGQSLSIAKP